MTAPLEVPGGAAEASPEAVLAGGGVAIQGRSLGQIAWIRLKRDRVAIVGLDELFERKYALARAVTPGEKIKSAAAASRSKARR